LIENWRGLVKGSSYRPVLKDFREAARRISGVAVRTPLVSLRKYREDHHIKLKPETLQPIGSYKIRGVYNWACHLDATERSRGIATLSAGNMAQALGYVANIFNVPARAVLPDTAPKTKVETVKRYGVKVQVMPYDQLTTYLNNIPNDYCFLHPFGEFSLMDGHGTIGLEIMEDAPETDTIYVGVGSGFLASGIALAAKALRPDIRVIGVNAENSPHMYESLKAGKAVEVEHKPTLADGIAALASGGTLQLVKEALDDLVLVSEDQIRDAIRLLAVENKIVAEGAGAASLAAALAVTKEDRGNAVCVITGGSIDPGTLASILRQ